ncbi:MAG: hypothetical protein UX91_C0015G0023 [Candidatus Amesbacteria bacterium GW2011_GWB1_47_19]|nr:MAG: hypothetical protein UX91_C0015G0023 [Candidatus Amesbacteria bacterium GW2011_GWB1_47_19]
MKAPYFPLYAKNWSGSRHVLAMSGDEVKAYMYLLCEAWDQIPRATLPNDDRELASIAHISLDKWTTVKDAVLERFIIGTCDEHFGRLVAKFLIEYSRKYEKNKRPKNKNALRTRYKRDKNARLDNANANAACIRKTKSKDKRQSGESAKPDPLSPIASTNKPTTLQSVAKVTPDDPDTLRFYAGTTPQPQEPAELPETPADFY